MPPTGSREALLPLGEAGWGTGIEPLLHQNLCYFQIEGGSDFYILTIPFHHSDSLSNAFNNASIISKAGTLGLVICFFEELDIKYLWRLNHSVITSQHIPPLIGIAHKAQGVCHGQYRNTAFSFSAAS